MKCKKCKNHGGGAVCTTGDCEVCRGQTSAGAGSCPKVCKECSKKLNLCEMCGRDIDIVNQSTKIKETHYCQCIDDDEYRNGIEENTQIESNNTEDYNEFKPF